MTRVLAAVLSLFIMLGTHHAVAADCANPTRSEGSTVYNVDARVMQYCDGTEWVGMGPKAYIPVAVTFDGTADYLTRGADLSSVSDDKETTGAFWFRRNGGTGAVRTIYSNTNARFEISFTATNTLQILGKNAANTTILDINTTATYLDAAWHHVLFSFDLADASRRFIYVDNVSQALTITTFTNDMIDFTTGDHAIGATTAGGTKYVGDMADFWLETGTYIDLSVATNRQKFLTSSAKPLNLGSTGAGPTGSQPDIFLSGALASWHTNDGTGGGFTVNGGLTAASILPGGSISDVTSGMYSRWTMDQTTGSSILDSVGNDNLPWTDGSGNSVAQESVPGMINMAIDFDGSNDNVSGNYDDGALDFLSGMSGCSWFYSDGNQTDGSIFRWIHNGFNAPLFQLLVMNNSRRLEGVIWLTDDNFYVAASTNQASGYWNTAWHHACLVFDQSLPSSRLKIYVDGVQIAQHDAANFPNYFDTVSVGALMAIGRDSGPGVTFNGKIDDVRIYTRALTAEEVQTIHLRAVGCLNPSGAEGKMFYNATTMAMEFCNGMDWVKMGHAPAAGYTANGVTFDGTNDYLSKTSVFTGVADGKAMAGSFWVRRNTLGQQILHKGNTTATATTERVLIEFDANNKLHIVGRGQAAGAVLLDMVSAQAFTDAGWHHVMFSIDHNVASCTTSKLYVDGVADAAVFGTCTTATATDFAFAATRSNTIGAGNGGASKFNGDLADFWLDIGVGGASLDLTVAGNRAKFITTAGKPVDLGSAGTIPTGAAVDVFLSRDTSTWHNNDGGGGNFTLNGALTDAATDPGACEQAGPLTEVGNIATTGQAGSVWSDGTYIYMGNYAEYTIKAYSFNGSTFTLKDTYNTLSYINSIWGDGAYIYVANSANGVTALTFNGTNFALAGTQAPGSGGDTRGVWGDGTYIYVADNAAGLRAYTFNGTTFSPAGNIAVAAAFWVWGDGTYLYVADNGFGLRAFTFNGSTFTQVGTQTSQTNVEYIWSDGAYIYAVNYFDGLNAYTFNGSSFTFKANAGAYAGQIWGDGTYIYSTNAASGVAAFTFNGAAFSLVSTFNTPGTADDIWGDGAYIYVADDTVGGLRAYSGFQGCKCASPSRVAGTMVYNNDYNVMQYCAGVSWRRVGK